MRYMSFFHTTQQMRDRTKDVTRRLGWTGLKPGDHLLAVVKQRGVAKADIQIIGEIEVISIRREPLNEITAADCVREGFPDKTPQQFVTFFCKDMSCRETDMWTRIEFKHVN